MGEPHIAAKYIWTDAHGNGRNRYALFRRVFVLDGEPAGGALNIFADTRYRLIVNGVTLGHGPARFYVSNPEYDTYDLSPVLRAGRNVIAIVVNSAGCRTFHSDTSKGELIVWGVATDESGTTAEWVSDESFRAMDSPGHRGDTHYLSFALNPAEHLDLSQMPPGWDLPEFDDSDWSAAVAVEDPDHWGELAPRSIPLLDEREVWPVRRIGTWAARPPENEDIFSLRVVAEGGQGMRTNGTVAVMTWIHSPRDQEVALGGWWGRYWLNGEELEPTARTDLGLRQDFPARLRKGWNEVLVVEKIRSDWWAFYLALPRDAGLTVSAEREIDSPHTFLIGGPWTGDDATAAGEIDWPLAGPDALPEALGPWRPWARGASADAPHRERAWMRFDPLGPDTSLQVEGRAYARQVGDGTLALLFDFEGEVLGRPLLRLRAAAGTVIDLTYTERLTEEGTAGVHARHHVDMAERYVTREGPQVIHTFHPRGFRYLEVLVRGDLETFELEKVALTRANYPVQEIGTFACSDPVLNDVWKLGRATLHACMEDAYLDCPWRERGLYSGDFLVQFHGNLAAYGDLALFRRCIEIFLQGQGRNGLIRPGAHGLPPGRHPDYSAILVQAMWDYYARSGDVAFLRESLGHLEKLLWGLETFRCQDSDLYGDRDMHPYIDLGHVERTGVTCALNCFYQRAFADGARTLDLLGEADLAATYVERAESLAAAIRREFWDADRRLFVDRPRSEQPDSEPSVPANVLPLLYDIADAEQIDGPLEWIAEAMLENFRTPDPRQNSDCNVQAYFSFYAIGVLCKYGRTAEAQEYIRRYWGRMLELGAWCCWEFLLDRASRCHAWSSSPTHYLSTVVLGVEFPEAGNPNRVRINPSPGTLQWAEGLYPHPAGAIAVRWEIVGETMVLEYDVPEGVEVEAPEPTGA